MKERLYLYDTTLRDGAQTLGVDFSPEDKRVIAERLDALGIDYIEGGYPGANPVDTAFFEAPPRLKAKLTAFGMTKRAGRSASNDPGFQAVATGQRGCRVPRGEVLGLSRRGCARHPERREPRSHRRLGRGGPRRRARGADRLRAFLRRL